MGLGPTSSPVVYRMESPSSTKNDHPSPSVDPLDEEDSREDLSPHHGVTQVVQQTWFILLLGGILLAILCLLVAALLVRRSLAKKKALSALSKSDPMVDSTCVVGMAGSVRGRDAFWSRGWSTSIANGNGKGTGEVEVQATLLPHSSAATTGNRPLIAPPEYAELLGHATNHHNDNKLQHPGGQLSLSSFLPRRNNPVQQQQPHPAAYATTTLVAHRNIQQQLQLQQQLQSVNHDPYAASCSAFSASDSSGYTTDELGDRCRRPYPSAKSSRSRQSSSSTGVKLLPNLGELLPPPPRHPPPSSPSLNPVFDRQNNEVTF